jgi:hypothetical protein
MMVKKTCRKRLTAFISTAKRYNHASPDILAVLCVRGLGLRESYRGFGRIERTSSARVETECGGSSICSLGVKGFGGVARDVGVDRGSFSLLTVLGREDERELILRACVVAPMSVFDRRRFCDGRENSNRRSHRVAWLGGRKPGWREGLTHVVGVVWIDLRLEVGGRGKPSPVAHDERAQTAAGFLKGGPSFLHGGALDAFHHFRCVAQ